MGGYRDCFVRGRINPSSTRQWLSNGPRIVIWVTYLPFGIKSLIGPVPTLGAECPSNGLHFRRSRCRQLPILQTLRWAVHGATCSVIFFSRFWKVSLPGLFLNGARQPSRLETRKGPRICGAPGAARISSARISSAPSYKCAGGSDVSVEPKA